MTVRDFIKSDSEYAKMYSNIGVKEGDYAMIAG